MIALQPSQIQQLAATNMQQYTRRVEAHLQVAFPGRCAELGDDTVRQWVQYGVERAQSYGLRTEWQVCCYLNIMFCFGRGFDVDDSLPWARSILGDPDASNPYVRMGRLRRAAEAACRPTPRSLDATG